MATKKPTHPKQVSIALSTGLLILTLVLTVVRIPSVHAGSTNNIAISQKELENFVDTEITSELQASGVPGAAIAIVKNGSILLAKGYGTMDKENNKPVAVNQTLFRVASVTKLFTWTAVMQLVEQGKLNLDADVNTYLKTFQIPNTYPHPITLANLMSHNAGFESDDALGYVSKASDLLPLGDYVARYIPARIRPPGEVSVYSNYGASLAGYIVEQTSGLPFDQYVETKILEPLGMRSTTLQQPLPADFATDMSKSYILTNGSAQPVPLGNYLGTPAGTMISTATDMAHFIIAHLQNGAYGNSRILQEATAQQMHSRLFTMDPRVPGLAHGFQEYYLNGQRIIGHFGVLDAFYSSLMLIPEQDLGWFIVYNGDNSLASPGAFLITFLNHYFQTGAYAAPTPSSAFFQRASQYTGIYRNARIPHSTFNKLISLSIEFEVTHTQHGTLLVKGAEYVEAESQLFKPYGSSNSWNDSLLFLKDSSGQQYLSNAAGIYERVPWFETSAFTWSLVAACSVFFVSTPTILFIRAYVERGKTKEKTGQSRWAKGFRWTSCAFSVPFLVSVVGIRLAAGSLTVWYVVMATAFLGSAFAIAAMPLAALSWRQHFWSLSERLHFTATTLVAFSYIWFLYNWNLLSFQLA